jgi:hypothetical protein
MENTRDAHIGAFEKRRRVRLRSRAYSRADFRRRFARGMESIVPTLFLRPLSLSSSASFLTQSGRVVRNLITVSYADAGRATEFTGVFAVKPKLPPSARANARIDD